MGDVALAASAALITRVGSWSGFVRGPVVLPFEVHDGDYLIAIVCPLDNMSSYLVDVTGANLKPFYPSSYPAYPLLYVSNGLLGYQVQQVTGPVGLTTPAGVSSWVGLVVYRNSTDCYGQSDSMYWHSETLPPVLYGTFPSSSFGSPDGTSVCVRTLQTKLIAPLANVSWPEYDNDDLTELIHWVSPAGSPDNGSNVGPDYGLRVTMTDTIESTPTAAQLATSTGPWDASYAGINWGDGRVDALVLITNKLAELGTDPDNTSPVGADRVPSGIIGETPLGIVDESGNVIVDEGDNTLIWS
jgi:hypothetical protein